MPVGNINHVKKGHPFFAFHVIHGDLKERCPVRLFRYLQELHIYFLRRPSPFFVVASGAAADNIIPGAFPPVCPRDNMIQT